MFNNSYNDNLQSIFSIDSIKDYKYDTDSDSDLNIDYLNSNDSQSHSTHPNVHMEDNGNTSINTNTNTNTNTNVNIQMKKAQIFSIRKHPKLSIRMKAKIERMKQRDSFKQMDKNNNNNTASKGVDKDKVIQLIYNDVYPSKADLTPQERLYMKRVKNRITAQASRDKKKVFQSILKRDNEELRREIEEKDNTIKALMTIINTCSHCSDKAQSSSQSPNANINTQLLGQRINNDAPIIISQSNNNRAINASSSSSSSSWRSFSIGGLIGIILCLCLFITVPANRYLNDNTLRALGGRWHSENEKEKIEIIHMDNKHYCCAQEIELNDQYTPYSFLDHIGSKKHKCLHKAKTLDISNSFVCKEFISAKLSNELNFDLVYHREADYYQVSNKNYTNDNDLNSPSVFKMIIPSFKYQNDIKPYIISLNSSAYMNDINPLSQYTYYEVLCQINHIAKITGVN